MGLSSRINRRSSRANSSSLTYLAYSSSSLHHASLRVASTFSSSQRYMSQVLILLETSSSAFSLFSRGLPQAPASSSDFPPVFHFISRLRHFRVQRYLLTISKTPGPLYLITSLQYLFFPHPHFCRLARFLSFPQLPSRKLLSAANFPICIFHLLSFAR